MNRKACTSITELVKIISREVAGDVINKFEILEDIHLFHVPQD